MQSGYNINDLKREAQYRWLKPAEVLCILQNHEEYQLSHQPPHLPTSGSLYLFNKRVLKFFRRDGHNWRKKRDQRTVGEAHERLKVGNVETLNCYYAHGEQNSHFQRRSYWMLDPAYDHIVLVHYRDVTKGKPTSAVSHSPTPSPQYLASTSIGSDANESSQSLSSPQSAEVSSDTVIKADGIEHLDGVSRVNSTDPSNLKCAEALNKIKQQLSLNDDILEDLDSFSIENAHSNSSGFLDYGENGYTQGQHEAIMKESGYSIHYDFAGEQHNFGQDELSDYILLQHSDDDNGFFQASGCGYALQDKESSSWKEMFESCSQETLTCRLNDNEKSLSSGDKGLEGGQTYDWNRMAVGGDSSYLLHEDKFENSSYPSIEQNTNPDSSYYPAALDNQQAFLMGPSLTVTAQQKYTIKDISPAWGYTNEYTKVIIVGSFLCDPAESSWACMFGETEVPVEIIQEGVIRCEAPPHSAGKVTICITSGNRKSCSEVREFEYQMKSNVCTHCNLSPPEASRSTDELLLLVRLVQLLLSDTSMQQADGFNTEIHLVPKVKADDDAWSRIIEALLVGSGTPSDTMNCLLEELLKDKLDNWLSQRSRQNLEVASCPLSKKEQGIIHMIAGLGYEWALNPILNSGVGIDFRDINGWTALHWAARFEREKMVASLIASGASPGAVTDPSTKDPTGKTPASVAATHGFKGLAGYLSEVSLTSHLSSLTLEESEFSKGSAEAEAERTLSSISKESLVTSEDHLSLQDSLAAVRNAAQAAARIQSAFRAHSFKKRLQKEASINVEEYGISRDDIQGLQALSKLSRNSRDYNSAALSIQKKYRGWKGRRDFLALRQKVVKIQAHVRGYQVRKNYKVICWAVGILDKAILRWRRKGVGLRRFRREADSIDDSEDEDILKVFRKQKVDAAIDEAVSRVLSMVESPEARQQYSRVLEKYRQVKAEFGSTYMEAAPATSIDFGDLNVEDYMFDLP